MLTNWSDCKRILVIRPDNMGDLIMSGPAIRALKESFNAKITVLTSTLATAIVSYMPEIDNVITIDLPWVKNDYIFVKEVFDETVNQIKERNFDAAVIFTVYSQNPLPTAMLAYMAGIPMRLAYCRENPYQLLTHWIPDQEPYTNIRHQVRRDLNLVANVGATTSDEKLSLTVSTDTWLNIKKKLKVSGLDLTKKWLILHPGVSEVKREYPIELWTAAGKKIIKELGYQVVITGSKSEKSITDQLQSNIGDRSFSMGGDFILDEFITLIRKSPIVISVNTGTIHIAAAVGTPVIVLYALTNPQHTPWGVDRKVLPFSVATALQSKNEVIRYINSKLYPEPVAFPADTDILNAINELLNDKTDAIGYLDSPMDEFGCFE